MMGQSFKPNPFVKFGLIATTAIALSACSTANKSPSIGDTEQKARVFAKTSGDVGAALTNDETLTARMVGVSAQELNYTTGATGKAKKVTISIRKDADGNLVLSIDGNEHTFTAADKDGDYGYYFEDPANGKYISLFSQTGEIDKLMTTGNGYAEVLVVQSTGISGLDGDYKAFAVVGTETEDDAVTAKTGKVTYEGYSRIDVVPNSGFQSNRDSRVTVWGDLNMEADFDAGTVSGTVDELEIRDAGSNVYVDANGQFNLEETQFDANGFEGDVSIDDTFATENDVALSDAGYSGAFYGPDAEEVAGTLFVEGTAGGDGVNGTGFFWGEDQTLVK